MAFFWLEKSAVQGVINAQYNLGLLYELGKGTKKNLDLAKYWYEQAAQQGDEKSIAKLECLSQCQ